jgi:hypothetical protein
VLAYKETGGIINPSRYELWPDTFESAGLPPFTPHSFRHMIVSEMYARKMTVAEFKAWSQNLGHEGAQTTLNTGFQSSFGNFRDRRPASSVTASATDAHVHRPAIAFQSRSSQSALGEVFRGQDHSRTRTENWHDMLF